jgi:hypothetical protein
MPRLNDPEPITDSKGKVLYDNELDRVKKMYGFKDHHPINSDLSEDERLERHFARIKHKRNRAK